MDHAGFLSELAIILAAAFLGGAVLQRLKQPVLVGYILVGVLLGPSVLGVVQNYDSVALFAELGILLLLFIVGIELDIAKFKPVYRIALSLTAIQIITGLGAMMGLAYLFDWTWQRGLLLGFAVALSSTAVAIKMLQDMGEMDSHLGRVTIGVLIAQDLAVIPMFLIMGAVGADKEMMPTDYARILGAVLFMGAFIYGINRHAAMLARAKAAVRRFLPPRDQHTVIALGFCFSAAALSGALGLSASYGAFLAGILIGHLGNRERYEKEIHPIFNILIMVFFLSVGLLIDFAFLLEHLWQVLALLLAAMTLKTVVNVGSLRVLGLSWRHAVFVGATLGQIGEFSFVLAAIGLAAGAIGGEAHKMVVLVIALSLVATPLWMMALRRLGRLGAHLQTRNAPPPPPVMPPAEQP